VQETTVTSSNQRMEALYRTTGPKLWRSLLAYSSDPEIASDAVAEAFMQAIAHRGEIRSPERWLWTAAFRIAAGELSRRRTTPLSPSEPAYEMPSPADHIMTALKALPMNQRIAVVMHDYADRPTKEVADVLAVSSATVHVHLSRGRRRLRHLLEDSHG
jgi:RNA polymerase sigma-70 factor (ECF subfamily)